MATLAQNRSPGTQMDQTIPRGYGQDLAVRLICPDCQDATPAIVESFASGDLVCGNCGMVLGDRIVDTRSEWRTFANDEGDDPSRVGASANPLLDGMEQLDTTIGFRDGNTGVARELQRAAARTTGVRNDRSMLKAFTEITNKCEQISLPKAIIDIAKQLYKRVEEEKILRGKSFDAHVACCIMIACRQGGVPRTFREIFELTRVPKKTIGQCFKIIEQAFGLQGGGAAQDASASNGGRIPGMDGIISASSSAPGASSGTSAEDLLSRYINFLDLHPSVEAICREVVVNAREHNIGNGRSPVSIAGGALYFTTLLLGYPKPIKEIGNVAGVSESTIKLIYKLMYHDRHKLVDQKWIDEGKADMARLPPAESLHTKTVSTSGGPSAGGSASGSRAGTPTLAVS